MQKTLSRLCGWQEWIWRSCKDCLCQANDRVPEAAKVVVAVAAKKISLQKALERLKFQKVLDPEPRVMLSGFLARTATPLGGVVVSSTVRSWSVIPDESLIVPRAGGIFDLSSDTAKPVRRIGQLSSD